MTRQGAVAHWLYLIISGEADVWVDAADGRQRVAALESGDIFGEMGMLTGAPRAATVTARTDTTCYRLDKKGFESILRGRPDIAGAMAQVLSGRRAALEDRLAAAQRLEGPMRHDDILDSVRRFFGLTDNRSPVRTPATS
jgi:CRP-like cAMP-binding protein